jgi:hypothetical protein
MSRAAGRDQARRFGPAARCAARHGRRDQRGRSARAAPQAGRPPGVQAHRQLRRRVRGEDALHVFDLRGAELWRAGMRIRPSDRKKIVILGGGPNRIGQGIEFDYCCVHACFALEEAGYETIMVNCNPETVSTDYDTSDRLYFEPLTAEDVLEILRVEQSERRTGRRHRPVRRADAAQAGAGAGGCGHPDPRHLARCDRPGRRPRAVCRAGREAGLKQPANGIARSRDEASRWPTASAIRC